MKDKCAYFAHTSSANCADYARDILQPRVQNRHMGTVHTNWLRDRKKALGLSDAAIGKVVGIGRSNINRLISGSLPFDHKYTAGFAKALQMSVDEVLYRFGVRTQNPPSVGEPIMVPFHLPSEDALTAMFQAILPAAEDAPTQDERARRLALSFPGAFRAALLPHSAKDADEESKLAKPPRADAANRSLP